MMASLRRCCQFWILFQNLGLKIRIRSGWRGQNFMHFFLQISGKLWVTHYIISNLLENTNKYIFSSYSFPSFIQLCTQTAMNLIGSLILDGKIKYPVEANFFKRSIWAQIPPMTGWQAQKGRPTSGPGWVSSGGNIVGPTEAILTWILDAGDDCSEPAEDWSLNQGDVHRALSR